MQGAKFFVSEKPVEADAEVLLAEAEPAHASWHPETGSFSLSFIEPRQARWLIVQRSTQEKAIVELDDAERFGHREVHVVLGLGGREPPLLLRAFLLDALTGEPPPIGARLKMRAQARIRRFASEETEEKAASLNGEFLFPVAPGEHALEVGADGYLQWRGLVRAERGAGRAALEDPCCREALDVAVELERDPAREGALDLPGAVWLELAGGGNDGLPGVEGQVQWKALTLPRRSELFDRVTTPADLNGRLVVRGAFPPGEYENIVSVEGFKHTVVRVVVPKGDRGPFVVRLELEPEWADAAEAREAIPHLSKRLLEAGDWMRASRALARIGADALPTLIELLGDHDAVKRVRAVTVLAEIGRKNDALAGKVVPLLIASLEDADASVRGNAASYLGPLASHAEVAVPRLIRLLDDGSPFVRSFAADALGHIGSAARPALPTLERLRSDPDNNVRLTATTALKRLSAE